MTGTTARAIARKVIAGALLSARSSSIGTAQRPTRTLTTTVNARLSRRPSARATPVEAMRRSLTVGGSTPDDRRTLASVTDETTLDTTAAEGAEPVTEEFRTESHDP